ncbi:signal peptidase I [Arthrobacter sp.]|uniref:signal peptidase I n=1 Tax=Arthrobacter sp. TaxID=1667 RepID=UPI003A93CE38
MAQHLASQTRPRRRVPAVVGSVLGLVALVLAVFAALVLIIVPVATGSQTYSVLTNSMRPHLPPGTLVVSRPIAFQDLEVGDVITYQLESGRADVITHRIVSTTADQNGKTLLITQGDNNDLADDAPVREVQVRGKLFYAVPYAGFLANWLGNQDRGMGAQIAAVVLIGYGAWNVASGILARRKPSPGSADAPAAQEATAPAGPDTTREAPRDVWANDEKRMPSAFGPRSFPARPASRHAHETPRRSTRQHHERNPR